MSHYGSVLMKHAVIDCEHRSFWIMITHLWPVFYIKGMKDSLLSSTQLIHGGNSLESSNKGSVLQDKSGHTLLLVEPNINGHWLEAEILSSTNVEPQVLRVEENSDYEL